MSKTKLTRDLGNQLLVGGVDGRVHQADRKCFDAICSRRLELRTNDVTIRNAQCVTRCVDALIDLDDLAGQLVSLLNVESKKLRTILIADLQ